MNSLFIFLVVVFTGLFFDIENIFLYCIVFSFLHEAGHSMMAILVGAKVIDFNLLPLPYATCEVSNLNTTSLILIGLAGMFVPALISIIVYPKLFWFWYCNLLIKLISLLSFAISFISMVLYLFGVIIKNEDIVQVIDIWNNGVFVLIITMILSMIGIIRSIIKQKSLMKIMDYFKVQI